MPGGRLGRPPFVSLSKLRNTAYSMLHWSVLMSAHRALKEFLRVQKRPVRSALAALAAAALAACTTATPYQPYRPHSAGGIHGGYSEQRLAPDQYRVRFHGNSMTSRDRVEGYMLYRAAELTLQSGYDWLLVVDRNTEHDVRTVVQPDPYYRPWYGPGYGYWRPEWRYYIPGSGWNYWHGGMGVRFGPIAWTSGALKPLKRPPTLRCARERFPPESRAALTPGESLRKSDPRSSGRRPEVDTAQLPGTNGLIPR